jgi:hypothetical protein
MIFYLMGLLGYYKLAGKAVPRHICLVFFAAVVIPPGVTLYLLIHTHWFFQLLAFAAGIFCWTFIEYFIRRFFLHHQYPDEIYSTAIQRIIYLAMASALLAAAIWFSPYLFLPAGIAAGLVLYAFIHVLLKQSWAVKIFPKLRELHLKHQGAVVRQCYGVTVYFWDLLFNTHHINPGISGVKKRRFFSNKLKAENISS